ncbi:hypothetical protein M1247_12100 [Mycobacterium sp. 21AC1]|uniref:EspA/EspE family type VII secretion system effector n=1 Tax=[Mycobacterium] appelbergii TaxID=2939269 RepID=UPI0029390655|nr:EspA/EspE family type VII secretion system effector [Mycobacterium sp. 21AC1]MDV3125659.1 hypothetical protein [Mycobacterium sp. 21AC1]
MGTFVDVYSSANWFNGLVNDHPSSMGGNDGHVGWGMAGVGADFVGLLQPAAQELGTKLGAANAAKAAATPVIQAALLAMMGMANTCGFGDPDTGEAFNQGSDKFKETGQSLEATMSPDSWAGGSSDEYGKRNEEQQHRAARMAEIDGTVKDALANEAEQIDVTRKMLDRCQTTLGLSIVPAILAKAIVPGGPVISLGIEIAAVAATMPFALSRYKDLINNSAHNATLIRRAGAGYDQIAADAQA